MLFIMILQSECGVYILQSTMTMNYLALITIFIPVGLSMAIENVYSFACNVDNCQICSAYNFCGLCQPNHQLKLKNSVMVPQCEPISCFIANCRECHSQNICSECFHGFDVANNGTCIISTQTQKCQQGCLSCYRGECHSCKFGYNLNKGKCKIGDNLYIQRCMKSFSKYYCQHCIKGFIISPTFQCIADPGFTCNSVQNCKKCTISQHKQISCIDCLPGYQPSQKGCTKRTCPQNCQQCSYKICLKCQGTYQLYQNKCIDIQQIYSRNHIMTFQQLQCNITDCTTCLNSTACQACANGFTLSTFQTACIPCNISGCKNCTTPNFCSNCSNGLIPNGQGNSCINNCDISNCVLCHNSSSCSGCNPGYQLSSSQTSCILCTLEGCSQCSSTSVCQTCMTGYFVNSQNTCSLCILPCISCSNNQYTCASCSSPYNPTPASNGTCFTCNAPNCIQCSVNNTYNCTTCATNYKASNGSCVPSGTCSSTCAECTSKQCTSCISGYVISTSNSSDCVQCTAINCITCSSKNLSQCQTCLNGYFLSNSTCIQCPSSNCQTCNAQGCLTFKSSTSQIPVILNNITYASICDPGCAKCSSINPSHCAECITGFTLNSIYICIQCIYPCMTCSPSSPSTCISCYGNAILNQSTCITCNSSSNCLTCSSSNTSQCLTCPVGSVLQNQVCVSGCPYNCIVCSNTSSSICILCSAGFSAAPNGACLPCISNCRVCSGSAQGFCLQCGFGFYLNTLGNCVPCTPFCRQCNNLGCTTCLEGYTLGFNGLCIQTCRYPCATCASNLPQTCTSCMLGFFLQNNTCIGNLTCPNNVCYPCPIGYTLSPNNTCVTCGPSANCARCNFSNLSTCLSCLNGYYLQLNSNTCLSCPTPCVGCLGPSVCLNCTVGYTLVIQPVSSPGVCVQCQSPCSQCFGNPNVCTKCIDGYVLQGWNCLTTFNFGFYILLSSSPQYFYSNYQNLINSLSSPVNIATFQAITVYQIIISKNTVNISGNISTLQSSGSQNAGKEYNQISSNMFGQTIANMTIISFQLQVNGGSVPPNDGDHLGLILGIGIPILLIILSIIVVLYCICVKNKVTNPRWSNSPPPPDNPTDLKQYFQPNLQGNENEDIDQEDQQQSESESSRSQSQSQSDSQSQSQSQSEPRRSQQLQLNNAIINKK